jgi:hypothetical protein
LALYQVQQRDEDTARVQRQLEQLKRD